MLTKIPYRVPVGSKIFNKRLPIQTKALSENKDSMGRRYCYDNGKRVKCPGTPEKPKYQQSERPFVFDLIEKIGRSLVNMGEEELQAIRQKVTQQATPKGLQAAEKIIKILNQSSPTKEK